MKNDLILEYDLALDINYHSLLVNGKETIKLKDTVKELTLDIFDIVIRKVHENGRELSYQLDNDSKKLKIYGINGNEIAIDYETSVSEKMLYGIYKSRYGKDYFITTDFEPNGARMLFPCIDDPSYKAFFSLRVTTQKDLVVIGNTRVRQIEDLGDKSRHIFEKSPRMSTYIFYLGIGRFEQIKLKDKNVEFRVLARPGQAEKGQFALESAARFLRTYEDYYSISYPLDKLDLIALPEYASGAMENWGAVTFREVSLLIDQNSSVANKRLVTTNLGHELAHMWFGDLVTMRWWNDLWLNESFATFMECKIASKLFPDWNLLVDFIQQQTAVAMHNDSIRSTHPIDEKVNAPEEISEIFDEISYGKGASVLRMIEAWIGEETFRKGVSRYLEKNKFKNAEGRDLWQELENASGQSVSEILESWIKKPGFPLVRVSYDNNKLKFSQERFLLRGKSAKKELWPVPINFTLNGQEQKVLLRDETLEISVDKIDSLKINSGQVGFFRTLYDENLYAMILMQFQNLDALDRWGIITDLFEFLEAGLVEKERYFSFVKNCFGEAKYIVADAVTSELQFLRSIAPESEEVRSLHLDYHRAQIDRLGLDSRLGENDTDKILRGKVAVGLALSDEAFAKELSSKFKEYQKLDPNIRTAAGMAFAQVKGKEGYEEIVNTMKRVDSESDIAKLYAGLTSFKDPDLVKRALDFCIAGEISRADSLYAVLNADQNPFARETTWNWIKDNIGIFQELFHGTPYVWMIMQDAISRTGVGRENRVKEDLQKMDVPEAQKGIKKGLELLEIYSSLRMRL